MSKLKIGSCVASGAMALVAVGPAVAQVFGGHSAERCAEWLTEQQCPGEWDLPHSPRNHHEPAQRLAVSAASTGDHSATAAVSARATYGAVGW